MSIVSKEIHVFVAIPSFRSSIIRWQCPTLLWIPGEIATVYEIKYCFAKRFFGNTSQWRF